MKIVFLLVAIFLINSAKAQKLSGYELIQQTLNNPPEEAKPWVFWYWINGCVNKEAVTADLEAMKRVGLGGAYLMFIKDTSNAIDYQPQIRQLTPEWYAMVRHAMKEAKRLKLKLGLHISDGFALAGGPWIKPEESMQKLVWTKYFLEKNNKSKIISPQPETNENYYEDIKVYAYPANYKNEAIRNNCVVTNDKKENLNYLLDATNKKTYRADTSCYINFSYEKAFTLRQIKIGKQNNAYQAQRFIIQKSEDGINYTSFDTLHPPRHGWQDNTTGYTHAIKNTTAKYFRLVWTAQGSEPGSEELDAAKWKPVLRVQHILLSDEPTVNNIEAKNGSVWRVANTTNAKALPKETIINEKDVIDITKYMHGNGTLQWLPKDDRDYIIVRIGHTSTGMKNETAGGCKGLECDKLNGQAVTKQFKNWFETIYKKTNAQSVVNTLHIDSWECGSQNWTTDMLEQFKQLNKYELNNYLLTLTGTPINSVAKTEKVLLDYRNTINALMQEKFYGTIQKLAKPLSLQISAEATAPTFVADGLQHYKYTDVPMGEFWYNSPTHDKPNDLQDAIHAAHMYGKNIVQAEAFTTLRTDFSETPATLKQLGDWAFAQGVNKLAIHVWAHNPWMDRKPGMTLNGIGLYYQRDQTWFEQSKAWIDYLTRTQALLQLGKRDAPIAVYIGDEMPSRAILTNKLIHDLPALFSEESIAIEKERVANKDLPIATKPAGVSHTANTLQAQYLHNALNGYQYNSINKEILLQLTYKNKTFFTPYGTEYKVLIIPNEISLNPNRIIDAAVINKLNQLAKLGAPIFINKRQWKISGTNVNDLPLVKKSELQKYVKQDVQFTYLQDKVVLHKRKMNDGEIFYLSNQSNNSIDFEINTSHRFLYSVNAEYKYLSQWNIESNTEEKYKVDIAPSEAIFFYATNQNSNEATAKMYKCDKKESLEKWEIVFKDLKETVTVNTAELKGIESFEEKNRKYYSGKLIYKTHFFYDSTNSCSPSLIVFENIYGVASLAINGKKVADLWHNPFERYVGNSIKYGNNIMEIEVTTPYHNLLLGNELHKDLKLKTYHNSPYKLKEQGLLPAGIVGRVYLTY